MSSLTKATTTIRVGVVLIAAGVTVFTLFYLASMPPPPPDSDGFAHGMAAAIGGGIVLSSLSLATFTIIAPTLLGREDPIGFNPRQRIALQSAGGGIGLGVVIALLTGLEGVVLLLALVTLAFAVVCAVLVWRFIEVLGDR